MTSITRTQDPRARLILCWLPILSLDQDLLLVNGHPVLTNWGLVPSGTMEFTDKLAHHLMHGLGQFLPEGVDVADVADLIAAEQGADEKPDNDAPSEPQADPSAATLASGMSHGMSVGMSRGLGAANVAPKTSPESEAPASPPLSPPHPQQASASAFEQDRVAHVGPSPVASPPLAKPVETSRSPRCWLPVLIACIVALLLLLLLLLPGILVFPKQNLATAMLGNLALEQSEAALRSRISELKSELASRSCRAPATMPALPATTPQGSAPANPVMPDAPRGNSVTDVVTMLDQATVLIVAGDGTRSMSSGSGFFVGPDLIVTNRHVVEASPAGHVIVVNKALGGARKGKVIATSATSNLGEQDYALIKMLGDPFQHALSLSKAAAKGQQIYAAGYPSIFMETDEHFIKLLAGIVTSAPDMVLTQGIVTVLQDSPSGNRMVLHSADISPGNSGGPLADKCGRVIGVNTFVKTSSEQQVRLNFALKSDSLLSFLAAQNVPIDQQDTSCSALASDASAPQQPTAAQSRETKPANQVEAAE